MLDSLLTHMPPIHAHLQEGVGNWTQAYFIFFTRNPVNQLLMRECRIMRMQLFKTQGNAERHHFLPPVLNTLHEMNLLGAIPSTNTTKPTILTVFAVLSDTFQRLKSCFIQKPFCSHWAFSGLITALIPTGYPALAGRTVQKLPYK